VKSIKHTLWNQFNDAKFSHYYITIIAHYFAFSSFDKTKHFLLSAKVGLFMQLST